MIASPIISIEEKPERIFGLSVRNQDEAQVRIERPSFVEWYIYVAYFFGGAFLVNAVPHFTNGVSGRSFPTPFASPPGKGLSSPATNVMWGTFNLAVGYALLVHVGHFDLYRTTDVLVLGAGGLLMGIQSAKIFGRSRND
jgi:hypothetical protein